MWLIFHYTHSPLYYHRMIDRMDIVEIPSVMETSPSSEKGTRDHAGPSKDFPPRSTQFVQPFEWEDQW